MPAMPAWCPQCNTMVDGAGGIYIEGGTHTLAGNTVSCPRGHRARVIEGKFTIRDGIIDVIRASPWTRDKLAEFQSALQWAVDNYDEDDPGPTVARLAAVHPEAAPFLQRMLFEKWSRSDVMNALILLLTLVGVILAAKGGDIVFNFTESEVNNYINDCPIPVPGEDVEPPAGPPTQPPESPPPPGPAEGGSPIPPEPPAPGSPL